MKFSKPITEIIQERTSHRTYSGQPLEKDLREKVRDLLENHDLKTPFSKYAGNARFELISIPEFDNKEKKKLGTYGFIKHAQDFIVGAVEKSQYSREHYGYILEKIILAATDLGLGTCWLGGFFNRRTQAAVESQTILLASGDRLRISACQGRGVNGCDHRAGSRLPAKGDGTTDPFPKNRIDHALSFGQYAALLDDRKYSHD